MAVKQWRKSWSNIKTCRIQFSQFYTPRKFSRPGFSSSQKHWNFTGRIYSSKMDITLNSLVGDLSTCLQRGVIGPFTRMPKWWCKLVGFGYRNQRLADKGSLVLWQKKSGQLMTHSSLRQMVKLQPDARAMPNLRWIRPLSHVDVKQQLVPRRLERNRQGFHPPGAILTKVVSCCSQPNVRKHVHNQAVLEVALTVLSQICREKKYN